MRHPGPTTTKLIEPPGPYNYLTHWATRALQLPNSLSHPCPQVWTNTTQKTKYRATRTSLKPECSGRVGSCCSICKWLRDCATHATPITEEYPFKALRHTVIKIRVLLVVLIPLNRPIKTCYLFVCVYSCLIGRFF